MEKLLGVPVKTFAYPFGKASSGVINYVHFAKYIAGMGLGYTGEQGKGNLFFLQRWEVQSNFSMKSFAAFLPWKGDAAEIPGEIPHPDAQPRSLAASLRTGSLRRLGHCASAAKTLSGMSCVR